MSRFQNFLVVAFSKAPCCCCPRFTAMIVSSASYRAAPMYILDEVDAALDLSHTQVSHASKYRNRAVCGFLKTMNVAAFWFVSQSFLSKPFPLEVLTLIPAAPKCYSGSPGACFGPLFAFVDDGSTQTK